MKRLVMGILAHVDSGKTTLSEAMLFSAGILRHAGRVDHGDAFLDTDAQERARGITIFSKQALLPLDRAEITLLDTPGHADFSPEMERTLQVLDYAILVISGTDGVQSHTETLWQLLRRHNIPAFLFINKMDLPGPGREALMEQLRTRLSDGCIDFSADLSAQGEHIAMCHESLMEDYLTSGSFDHRHLCRAIRDRALFPCFFGSALKNKGVDLFLDALQDHTLPTDAPAIFGAQVFKIARDPQGNRLTYLKVVGGTLPARTLLHGFDQSGSPWAEKVNEIRLYSGTRYTPVAEAEPGMVCAVTGLSHTYPGMGLGCAAAAETPVLQPVMTYRVELPEGCDPHTAMDKLSRLQDEDPMLHITWNEALQEIRVQLMGQVQLEILRELIRSRFDLAVQFVQGSIIYLETITNTVEGVGHFEPLRHYAEVHLLLEPGPRGSGLTFATTCDENDLDRNWQRLILTHLEEKAHLGVLTGAPITDIKITLAAGKAHLKHTEGGDFRQATYRAVRQGLMQADSILLEPYFSFRLTVPMESVGRAMSDLQRMGGTFAQQSAEGDLSVLTGRAPVSELQDYPLEVAGYTHGRGQISCSFDGYDACHNQAAVLAACSYDPVADLDNSPDSVFCSHGAGTIIKWNEVPEHMHLPSCLVPQRAEPPVRTWEQRAADYYAKVATDKELQAIFERTYGPIKRNLHAALHTPKQASASGEKRKKLPAPPAGPEYLLVDGYNIIFAWDELKALAADNLDAARNQLIHTLCNYQGIRQCELILVFDAYKVKGSPGSVERVGNISVVYTKEAETADMYIERVTHQIGPKRRVRVATSDGMIQMIILGHGALRVPARSFYQEVMEAESAMRDFLAHQNDNE